eukprot:6491389-Amphidinium_carterae.2
MVGGTTHNLGCERMVDNYSTSGQSRWCRTKDRVVANHARAMLQCGLLKTEHTIKAKFREERCHVPPVKVPRQDTSGAFASGV